MSKDQKKDLLGFLQPFDRDIQGLALWLREWVWDLYPHANELIYDNFNALAFGWSPTDRQGHIFGSVALYRGGNVHFGFYWALTWQTLKNCCLAQGINTGISLSKISVIFPKLTLKSS